MKFFSDLPYLYMSVLKSMIINDWFIGMLLGTDEYLAEEEKKILTEKCENVIIEYLENEIASERLKHMINKGRGQREGCKVGKIKK
jgi:hypothetical protein